MAVLAAPCMVADGGVYGLSTVYAAARSTSTGHDSAATSHYVGQLLNGADFYVQRMALKFDTSSIPVGSTVSAVTMGLVCITDGSTADFDVQIVKQNWSAQDPLNDLNREAFFDGCLAGDAESSIWRNTSGMSVETVYTSGALSTAWVTPGGYTYYSLRSSLDSAGTQPAAAERVAMASQDNLTAGFRPVLNVTYTLPSGFKNLMLMGVA